MNALAKINGDIPPQPVSMIISKSDLYSDSSKRTAETGRLLLYPIRQNIYSLDLEFLLDSVQTGFLEELISSRTFYVEFYDGNTKIRTEMYCSDIKKELQGAENSRKFRISFNLIEI